MCRCLQHLRKFVAVYCTANKTNFLSPWLITTTVFQPLLAFVYFTVIYFDSTQCTGFSTMFTLHGVGRTKFISLTYHNYRFPTITCICIFYFNVFWLYPVYGVQYTVYFSCTVAGRTKFISLTHHNYHFPNSTVLAFVYFTVMYFDSTQCTGFSTLFTFHVL